MYAFMIGTIKYPNGKTEAASLHVSLEARPILVKRETTKNKPFAIATYAIKCKNYDFYYECVEPKIKQERKATMLSEIYAHIGQKKNERIEQLLDKYNPNFNWDLLEDNEHDWLQFIHDVDCDEEWDIWMNECSKYIQERLPGYTLLVKDLRKKNYSISRSGEVSPK